GSVRTTLPTRFPAPERGIRKLGGPLRPCVDGGRLLELVDRDLLLEAVGGARVEHARAKVARRLRAAGDPEPQCLGVRPSAVAGGQVPGEEDIAGPDRRNRLEPLGPDLVQAPLVVAA